MLVSDSAVVHVDMGGLCLIHRESQPLLSV